jgi:AraC-like DNA-binding protein
LRPGTLALARAGTVDSYQWDAGVPSTHAYVHFRLGERPAHPGCPDHQEWPAVRSMTLLPVLDGCCRYLLQLAGDPSSAAAVRRDELITLMVDIFLHGPLPAAEPELPHFMITVADRVRADWDTHGIRPIGVEALAAAVGLSAGHLHRLFRDHVGLGPGHALELVRLARAAEALQRSNASIAEIAELTGFANPYHFSRRFRRAYGQPPGTYRHADHHVDPLAPLQQCNLLALSYRLG